MKSIFNHIIQQIQPHVRYISNLGFTFASQAVSALSIIIITPVLLQSLGKEDFGWYGSLLNLITISAAVDLGMNVGLLRRIIHEPNRSKTLINTLFFFFLGMIVVAIPLFGWLFEWGVFKTKSSPWLSSVCVSLLTGQFILAYLFDTVIQSVNKIYLGKLIRMMKLVIEVFVWIWLASYKNVFLLLMGSAVVNTFYIVGLYLVSMKQVSFNISTKLFSWSTLKDHFFYSQWYFWGFVATMLNFNGQIFLLSQVAGNSAVSNYLLVFRFFEVIRIGMTNFTTVLFPRLASIQYEGNWKQLKHIFIATWLRVAGISLVFFGLLAWKGPWLFQLWSKVNDPEVMELFFYFGLFIWLIVLDSVAAIFLSALGIHKIQTIIAIGQGAISLTLAYLLLPSMGLKGVAIASCIALVSTNFFFNPWFLWREIKRNGGR